MRKAVVCLIVIAVMFPVLVRAEDNASEDSYFYSDLKKYFTAPVRWDSGDWTEFGLIVGGIYLVSEKFDESWKDEMTKEDHPYYYQELEKIGNAWGDLTLSGPFMLGVYGYGRWADDIRYVHASQDMFQSVVYAGAMTQVLKQVFSRDRPNVTNDESGWFGSGSSFPSGHTSVAFAVSRSFLNSLDNPSIATQALFYGLATSTALARTYDNYHWASDVVAGALLGIYTADFVSEQNKKHRNSYSFMPYIGHNTIGFQMSW